jgi:archaellum biogenesis protein FlaJ (TadC family)
MGEHITGVKRALAYAHVQEDPYAWFGLNINVGTLITAIVIVLTYFFMNDILYTIAAGGLTPLMYYFAVTGILSMLSDQRARFVESTLPDALLLMASNLRSGMPTDEAVTLSSRPEFGFLADKIKEAGRRIATGETFADALRLIPADVDSQILRKTMELIVEGLESGGEIATLLEETSTDIRDNDILQREVRSVILIYAIFIFIAAIVMAPVLYAISTHLAQALSKLSSAVAVAFMTGGNSPTLKITPSLVTPEFMLTFAYINLIITAVFGSLMVALITRGNEKYGIRYIPVFIAITMIVFVIVRYMVGGFFATVVI